MQESVQKKRLPKRLAKRLKSKKKISFGFSNCRRQILHNGKRRTGVKHRRGEENCESRQRREKTYGENFAAAIEGKISNVGFFVTRYLYALDVIAAGASALDAVAAEMKMKDGLNGLKGGDSTLRIDEIFAS